MNLFKFFCPVLLGALVSCAGRSDWRKDASNLIGEGRFSQLDSVLEEAEPGASEQELRAIDSLREVMRRLRIEFCYNEEQILSRIRQRVRSCGVCGISGADPSMGKVREVGDAADRRPEALLQPFGRQPDSAGPGTGRIAADRLVGDRFSGKARRAGDCGDRFAGNVYESGDDDDSLYACRGTGCRAGGRYDPLLAALSAGRFAAPDRHRTDFGMA